MKKHIFFCDYIRAISAVFVVLFHYTTRYNDLFGFAQPPLISFPWGSRGVAVFFILSGFLTTITINSNITPLKWLKSRFTRLYPVYWTATICTFLVTLLFLKERAVSLPAFLVNFTMLQDFIGVDAVDGAYWTLRYELTFYLFVLIVIIIKKTDKFKICMWVWFAGAVAVNFLSEFISIPGRVVDFLLPQYISTFVIGVTVGSMMTKKKASDYVVIVLAIIFFFVKNGFVYTAHLIMMVILFVLLACSDKLQQFKAPEPIHNGLCFLAGISYPLYLIHQNIGYAVICGLDSVGILPEISVIATFLLATILAAVLNFLDRSFFQPNISKLCDKGSDYKIHQ